MDRRDRQDNPLLEWAKKIRAQWAQAQRAIFGAPTRPPRTEVPDYRSVGPRRIDNPFRRPGRDTVPGREVYPPATPMVSTPPDWLTRRPERMDENKEKKFNKRRNPNMQ